MMSKEREKYLKVEGLYSILTKTTKNKKNLHASLTAKKNKTEAFSLKEKDKSLGNIF